MPSALSRGVQAIVPSTAEQLSERGTVGELARLLGIMFGVAAAVILIRTVFRFTQRQQELQEEADVQAALAEAEAERAHAEAVQQQKRRNALRAEQRRSETQPSLLQTFVGATRPIQRRP